MNWKKILLIIACFALLIFAFLAVIARNGFSATDDELTFTWVYSEEAQAEIEGYRLYDGQDVMLLDAIPPEARETSVFKPSECTSYHLTAYNEEGIESKESHKSPWCPPEPVVHVSTPGDFIVKLIPVEDQIK